MDNDINSGDLLDLTASIVSAHVANNSVAVGDVPKLIKDVYSTLATVSTEKEAEPERPEPAVSIKASIKPDYIVCLEDGKKLKILTLLPTLQDFDPTTAETARQTPSR